MKPKLKPCPFPGCKSVRVVLSHRISKGTIVTVFRYFVQCKKCLCRGPEFELVGMSKVAHKTEKDKAIEAWNRRPGEWSQKMPEKNQTGKWFKFRKIMKACDSNFYFCSKIGITHGSICVHYMGDLWCLNNLFENHGIEIHSQPIDMRCDE